MLLPATIVPVLSSITMTSGIFVCIFKFSIFARNSGMLKFAGFFNFTVLGSNATADFVLKYWFILFWIATAKSKSLLLSDKVAYCWWYKSHATALSTVAPFITLTVVVKCFCFLPPFKLKPPILIGPWAKAYIFPFTPLSGVISKTPPCKDLASPIEETVMSILSPSLAKGGKVAVTITAATFLDLMSFGSSFTFTFLSKFDNVWFVNFEEESPLPSSPTTNP